MEPNNESPTLQNKTQYRFGQIYNWMASSVPLFQKDEAKREKSLSDFLYNTASKVYQMVVESTPSITATQAETKLAMPPWFGYKDEQKVKEQCLSLTLDRRNFVKPPPDGVDFKYDHDVYYLVAQAALKSDENLAKLRYQLVPGVVSEENFWRSYFYRVWLICKAEGCENLEEELDIVIKEQWVEELELELRELEENESKL